MEKRRLRKSDLSRRLLAGGRGRPPKPADAGTSELGDPSGPSAGKRLVVRFMSSPDGLIDMGEFITRLSTRLEKRGLSAHAAALRAGLSPSQIGTMRRQHKLGLQHGVSIRTAAKLATALGTTPEWLLYGTGPEEAPHTGALETSEPVPQEISQQVPQDTPQRPHQEIHQQASQTPEQILGATHQLPPREALRQPPRQTPQRTHRQSAPPLGLRVAGSVAAGVWVEPASGNIGPQLAAIPVDPRYPAEHQSAFEVRDTSIDRVARPGDYLIVVDRLAAQLPLRTGDLVIVTQQKSDLQEVTARRLTAETTHGPHGCRLDFESSDPRSRHPLVQIRDMRNDVPGLSIGGVVVSVWRPLLLTR